jgi:hypothetical protein
MFQQEIHQGQMAQVTRQWRAIVLSAPEPITNSRNRASADISDLLLANLPLGVKVLGCHPQLTLGIKLEQVLLSLTQRTKIHQVFS